MQTRRKARLAPRKGRVRCLRLILTMPRAVTEKICFRRQRQNERTERGLRSRAEDRLSIFHFVRPRHGDDVVARIDEVHLACHPLREPRKQINGGAADILNSDCPPQRRMGALKI